MATEHPIKVALVTNGDAADPTIVSGVPYFVTRAISESDKFRIVGTIDAKPLRVLRWAVRVLTWHRHRRTWDARYVHSTHLARLRSMSRDFQTARLDEKPDLIIHIRSWYYPPRTPYASFIDATADMLQGVSRSWTSPESVHAAKRRVESEMYNAAHVVYSASEEAKRDLIDNYGLREEKVQVVGGGVNFDSYPVDPADSGHRSNQTILFVGKDPERKGVPELLDAFKKVQIKFPKAKLMVVGFSTKASIPGVEFVGELTSRDEMAALYRSCTVFCLPSRQESFGLVIPEAMAHGMPCVVTDIGELPRLVSDGESGFVVPVGDVDALAGALVNLLEDPCSAAAMGRMGWQITKNRTWKTVVERMQEGLQPPFVVLSRYRSEVQAAENGHNAN